ncbi:MAG: glycosyltransferase family 4 protein [Bacteroidota bacterium]
MLIGPVTNTNANLVGGATISFGYLIDYLKNEKESFTLVNTQRFPKGKKRTLNPFYVFVKVLLSVAKADVIFLNCSDKGIKYLSPLLFYIAKIFNLKYVVRPFGGDFKDYTDRWGSTQKTILARTTLKADLLFLQTKKLIAAFDDGKINLRQLPTSRDTPTTSRENRIYDRRFVYLGFVNHSKGVDHLLEAAKFLGDTYQIHIYGPIRENYEASQAKQFEEQFREQRGIYQGVLPKAKVMETLREYDVLVLPTFYQGEGYPGVIIEAYSLGLPVITTQWKAIPEIVEDQKTGLLIEPRSTEALIAAMQFFNPENYPAFSANAKRYFEKTFSTRQVSGNAIAAIKALF